MTLQDIYNDRSLLKGLQGVYRIQCKVNNKNYVGQSKDLKRRFYDHFRCCFNKNNPAHHRPLYEAIRTHGLEAFRFFHECNSLNPSDEADLIKKYNCVDNGYNARKSHGCFDRKAWQKVNDKKRYQENKEAEKARATKYRKENKEKYNATMRKYRQENKEKSAANNLKWREKNRDTLREKERNRYQENKETINARRRQRYQENKETINARRRKRRKELKEQSKTNEKTIEI